MLHLFLIQALVFLATVGLYFQLGLRGGLVFTVFWFDILLHVLGGLWIGLAAAWFFSLLGLRLSAWHVLMLALAGGGMWEAFEYVYDIGGSNFMSYQMDTIKDLVDDGLGGAIAALYVRTVLRDTIS